MSRDQRHGGRWWIAASVVVLVAFAGGYYSYTHWHAPQSAAAEEAEEPELSTATVTRGDIVISATGTADLVPAAEVELGFRTSGVVTEVLVEAGDSVEPGALLARLSTDNLERALAQSEVELEIARLELQAVQEGPDELEIASAEAAVQDAEVELVLAEDAYEQTSDSRLDGVIQSAKVQYDWYVGYYQRQKAEYEAGRLSDADHDWAMAAMMDAEGRWQAAINEAEIEEVQALTRIDHARNSLAQAQRDLEILYSGPTTDTLIRAMLEVDQALLAYEKAVSAISEAELHARIAGTVMQVSVSRGEEVAANASVVTLADLADARLQLWLEEADSDAAAVGNRVFAMFEAHPDLMLTGEIIRVDPALVSMFNTNAIQCLASLELPEDSIDLRAGMTAEVEVFVAETHDALLVPVEALQEVSTGQYSVIVVGADGELEARAVEVGLVDYVSAEILAGVEDGETVVLNGAG